MYSFRSPFLKKVPRTRADVRAATLTGRMLIPALMLLALGVPAFLIDSRVLEPQGPGFVLYWVHDHLLLPFVGQTYTRFYPWSLAWWLPLLGGLGLWLLSYLSFFPIIRRPHSWLTRLAVGNKVTQPYLLMAERLLQRWGGPSLLLAETVLFCFRECFLAFRRNPDGHDAVRLLRRMVRFTLFYQNLASPGANSGFRATLLFSQTLAVLLERNLTHPEESEVLRLAESLGDQMPRLFCLTLPSYERTDAPPGFLWPSLLATLETAVALVHRRTAVNLFGPDIAADPNQRRLSVCRELAAAMSARRLGLAKTAGAFEQSFRNQTGVNPEQARLFHGLGSDQDQLSLQGLLAMDLALIHAVVTDDAHQALGYLDAWEGLMLAVNLDTAGRPPRRRGDDSSILEARVRPLYERLPRPTDFQLCTRLLDREDAACREQVKNSLLAGRGREAGLLPAAVPMSPGSHLLDAAAGPGDPWEVPS